MKNIQSYLGPSGFRIKAKKKNSKKNFEHLNGIKKLTRAEFEIPYSSNGKKFKNHFQNCDDIGFKKGNRIHLTLEFDNLSQEKSIEFRELNLTINY